MVKNRKRGKRRIPIIMNPIYSSLIFQVASGNNYSQKIYDAYNKEKGVSVVSRQLDILEKKEKILFSETKEDKTVFPMQKIRLYSVNWGKVIELFYDFYFKDGKRTGMSISAAANDWMKNIYNERIIIKSKEHIQKNKYLISLFEKSFALASVKSDDTSIETISELFESVPIVFINSINESTNEEKSKITSRLKKDEEFKDFFGLLLMIYLSYYKISVTETIKKSINYILENN